MPLRGSKKPIAVQMKDVAAKAGVSISTVSHVLNNTREVADQTRDRVLATMRQLNYYKNASGRRLARGRSDAFGLIISDIENPFFPELVKNFEQSVIQYGFDVFLSTTNYDQQQAKNAVRRMIENKVQGVAVMTSQLDSGLVDELLSNDVPVVLLDGGQISRGRSNVRIDYSRGAREVVEYLHNLGHRTVSFITGPQNRTSSRTYKHALTAALERTGFPSPECIEADNTIEGGRAAMFSLLGAEKTPTAVLCGNDLAALGAMRALVESGISVPSQISVIGSDDIPFAQFANPPLSTVRVARDQVGKLAFLALQRLVRTSRRQGAEYVVETRLLVRGSSSSTNSGAPSGVELHR